MKKPFQNINSGTCPGRIQQGNNPFFVNWQEDEKQNYQFFSIVSAMYSFKKRLQQVNNGSLPFETFKAVYPNP